MPSLRLRYNAGTVPRHPHATILFRGGRRRANHARHASSFQYHADMADGGAAAPRQYSARFSPLFCSRRASPNTRAYRHEMPVRLPSFLFFLPNVPRLRFTRYQVASDCCSSRYILSCVSSPGAGVPRAYQRAYPTPATSASLPDGIAHGCRYGTRYATPRSTADLSIDTVYAADARGCLRIVAMPECRRRGTGSVYALARQGEAATRCRGEHQPVSPA